MKMSRIWAMPNSLTFTIKPIKDLLVNYCVGVIIDPFANNSKIGTITNDINPEMDTHYHLDALQFLKLMKTESADVVIYDPPYSISQAKIVYDNFGTDKLSNGYKSMLYWKSVKDECKRICKPNGIVICCGWSSNGLGLKRDFEMLEILLVPHGGSKNDTIVTVERKNIPH